MNLSSTNYKIKNNFLYTAFLCLSILAIPMSFPLQVVFMSPLMALLPYFFLLISLFLVLPIFNIVKINYIFINIPFSLYLFVFFVLFNQLLQYSLGLIPVTELISSISFLILPIFFYIPFRFFMDKNNLKYIYYFILFGGLVGGIFYIYDTFSRFVFFELTSYSKMAFEYTLVQQGITNPEEANLARVSLNSRSHGLMPSHSISSFWIMISYFSLMAIYNFKYKNKLIITLLYFLVLLLCMNFSAIFAFLFIIFFIYFEFFKIFFLKVSFSNILFIVFGFLILTVIGLIIFFNQDSPLIVFFINIVYFQLNLLFGIGGDIASLQAASSASFSQYYLENFINYIQIMLEFPFTALTGTGFSGTMMGYGGDTGIIETLSKFGPGVFIIILYGYLNLIYKCIIQIQRNGSDYIKNQFKFIASVLLVILVYEYHYSIWSYKYVFPIFIIAYAMFHSLTKKNNIFIIRANSL